MLYSVFGSTGFIGGFFADFIESKGIACKRIPREYNTNKTENLGHIVYSIGLTADFRNRPMDTVKAHVTKLVDVLENSRYESFLYLSSTRVYSENMNTSEEASLVVNPNNFSDLYNISKLMGESVCLSINNPNVRIARLSNVLGHDIKSDNFVNALVREAIEKGEIILQSSPDSEKDYISVEEVVKLIELISQTGRHRLYNIASGYNSTNREIFEIIQENTGCEVVTDATKPLLKFSPIKIDRIKMEFDYMAGDVSVKIKDIILNYKSRKQ